MKSVTDCLNMTYHHHETYFQGYSVLPKLLPLCGTVLNFPEEHKDVLALKQDALQHQQCYFEHDLDPITEFHICEYIRWIQGFKFQEEHARSNFQQLGPCLREDIAIHCLDDKRDWLAAAHICFPSGWLPEEKIGKSFHEIHEPIPGMRLNNSRKLVEAMIHSSPYERYVWSVIFEDRINSHPRFPKKKFDPTNPVLFVKYERQVIIGFPECSAALFIICQHLIPEDKIHKPTLKKALESMTKEQRIYKSIDESCDDLVRYLDLQPGAIVV